MSPKVGEFDGIEVSIISGDHGNPHVHAWYPGYKVKIFVETLEIEKGGLPPKQMKKLKKWIAENEEELLELWDEITGEG